MERCTITGMAAANHILAAMQLPQHEIIPPREPEWLARLMGAVVRLGRRTIGRVLLRVARLLRGQRRP